MIYQKSRIRFRDPKPGSAFGSFGRWQHGWSVEAGDGEDASQALLRLPGDAMTMGGEIGLGHNPYTSSRAAFERAKQVFPGGTTRITVPRRPLPVYMASGKGAWLTDVDGNCYLDFNNNFTTLIHGHAFPPVVEAVEQQIRQGACFANPTSYEVALAEILCARVPVIERLRFVNTGTEAVMFAVKAARAITGRTKIAKFEGAYHGAYDWVSVNREQDRDAGTAGAAVGEAQVNGIPASVLEEVLLLPFNDADATAARLEAHAGELAAVIIDLMPSRAGLIPVEPAYLEALCALTKRQGTLLICDEVLNFRQGPGGAVGRFGIEPDLVVLGKIIGGGLPVGAIGGPAHHMEVFDNSAGDPSLPQGGTFSANPLSMVAGIASMNALDAAAFDYLEGLGNKVRDGLREAARRRGLPVQITGMGSLFRVHLKAKAPSSYREARPTPREAVLLESIGQALLEKGVVMPMNSSGACSTPMTETDIEFFLDAMGRCLDEKAKELAELRL